jgi:hypothetical protein
MYIWISLHTYILFYAYYVYYYETVNTSFSYNRWADKSIWPTARHAKTCYLQIVYPKWSIGIAHEEKFNLPQVKNPTGLESDELWCGFSRDSHDLMQHTVYVYTLSNISIKTNCKQISRVDLKLTNAGHLWDLCLCRFIFCCLCIVLWTTKCLCNIIFVLFSYILKNRMRHIHVRYLQEKF